MKGVTWDNPDEEEVEKVSIHTPNEGSDHTRKLFVHVASVSIHTPNEGSDVEFVIFHGATSVVSIHTPNEGSDL